MSAQQCPEFSKLAFEAAIPTFLRQLGVTPSADLVRAICKICEAFYSSPLVDHTSAVSHTIAMSIAKAFDLGNGAHSFKGEQKVESATYQTPLSSDSVRALPRKWAAIACELTGPTDGASPLLLDGLFVSRNDRNEITNAYFMYVFGDDSQSWEEFAAEKGADVIGWGGRVTPFMAFVMRLAQTLSGWYAAKGDFDAMLESSDICDVALTGLGSLNKIDDYKPDIVGDLLTGAKKPCLKAALEYLSGPGSRTMAEAEPESRAELVKTLLGALELTDADRVADALAKVASSGC
jgi:hypothetical protein